MTGITLFVLLFDRSTAFTFSQSVDCSDSTNFIGINVIFRFLILTTMCFSVFTFPFDPRNGQIKAIEQYHIESSILEVVHEMVVKIRKIIAMPFNFQAPKLNSVSIHLFSIVFAYNLSIRGF